MSLRECSLFKPFKQDESKKSIELTSIDEIKNELTNIFVDIRLLQRTCDYIHFNHLRPNKFIHLSLEQAQNKHRALLPRMRELNKKLSDEEFFEVEKVVDQRVKSALYEKEDGLRDAEHDLYTGRRPFSFR